MAQRSPNTRIPNSRATDLEKLPAVHVPCNRLGLPARRRTVPGHTPGMPRLIWDDDVTTQTIWLIADTTGVNIAMRSAVASQKPINRLEDIKFSARRPPGSVPDGVTQDPERGPDPLLVCDSVCAESNISFGEGDYSRGRREGIHAFNSAGGPSAGDRAVYPGHQLDCTAAAQLDVGV